MKRTYVLAGLVLFGGLSTAAQSAPSAQNGRHCTTNCPATANLGEDRQSATAAVAGPSSNAAASNQGNGPFSPLESLIGAWDTGPDGAPPMFVQRLSWGPGKGYLIYRTLLLGPNGKEDLHFEGPVMWNARTGKYDFLFAVEPGSFAQEKGEIVANLDGSIVREIDLINARGSLFRFRQTIRPLGAGGFETTLMRETEQGWVPSFPGSDHLIMVRRPA